MQKPPENEMKIRFYQICSIQTCFIVTRSFHTCLIQTRSIVTDLNKTGSILTR